MTSRLLAAQAKPRVFSRVPLKDGRKVLGRGETQPECDIGDGRTRPEQQLFCRGYLASQHILGWRDADFLFESCFEARDGQAYSRGKLADAQRIFDPGFDLAEQLVHGARQTGLCRLARTFQHLQEKFHQFHPDA